jgi:hypothetical protein
MDAVVQTRPALQKAGLVSQCKAKMTFAAEIQILLLLQLLSVRFYGYDVSDCIPSPGQL